MAAPIDVRVFSGSSGKAPFDTWVNRLRNRQDRAYVLAAVRKIEFGNFGDSKSLRGGLYELRLHRGPGYRVYYGLDGPVVVILLGGGTKRTQERDIERARECWRAYRKEQR